MSQDDSPDLAAQAGKVAPEAVALVGRPDGAAQQARIPGVTTKG